MHPDLERAMAKRMGATTYEFDSSHVPMLSQPERVIDVIRAAAKAASGPQWPHEIECSVRDVDGALVGQFTCDHSMRAWLRAACGRRDKWRQSGQSFSY